MRLRLLDLDGSLRQQAPLREAAEAGVAQIIDLRAGGEGLRLWASRRQMRKFAARIAATPPPPGRGPEVTFFGSGDYHHLSHALIARVPETISVLHFDNHPDWIRLPPAFHCGSWVNRLLELPQVARVVTIGPCSNDLARPQLKGANLAALAGGRLELFPWRHAPSRVWGRIGSGPGHRQEGSYLFWQNVGGDAWRAFVDDLVTRLPTDEVWITIDKDVLAPADAVTNWDQGEMPLAALTEAIAKIGSRKQIVGIDICGEYAPPRFGSLLKRIAARLDHPANGQEPVDLSANARTNVQLLAAFEAIAA
jgi:arginase family enzyme